MNTLLDFHNSFLQQLYQKKQYMKLRHYQQKFVLAVNIFEIAFSLYYIIYYLNQKVSKVEVQLVSSCVYLVAAIVQSTFFFTQSLSVKIQ